VISRAAVHFYKAFKPWVGTFRAYLSHQHVRWQRVKGGPGHWLFEGWNRIRTVRLLIDGKDDGLTQSYRCEEFAAAGCKVYATARRDKAMDGFSHERIEKVSNFASVGSQDEARISTHWVSERSSWTSLTKRVGRASSTKSSENLVV